MRRPIEISLLVLLAGCSSASLSGVTGKKATAAAPKQELATVPTKTVVAGRLMIDTDTTTGDQLPVAIPAAGASVYLEGNAVTSYPAQQAGTFQIEVPDEAFEQKAQAGAPALGLTEQNVAWYAVFTQNGKVFGVEQTGVVIHKGETTDLHDVRVTATGELRGNVSVSGSAQSDNVDVVVPGTIFKATTDVYGNFSIKGIPAAAWRVQATKAGFETETTAAVDVPGNGAADAGTIKLDPK